MQQGQTFQSSKTPSVPAGWYIDPIISNQLRWWDGFQWTNHTATLNHISSPYSEANGVPSTAFQKQGIKDQPLRTGNEEGEKRGQSGWYEDPDGSGKLRWYDSITGQWGEIKQDRKNALLDNWKTSYGLSVLGCALYICISFLVPFGYPVIAIYMVFLVAVIVYAGEYYPSFF